MMIYVVSSVDTETTRPVTPHVFASEADAIAFVDAALRSEWEAYGLEDKAGDLLPYPASWEKAQAALTDLFPGDYGQWLITPHTITTDAAPSAPQTPAADPLDVLRPIHHEATTDIAGLPRDEALELVFTLGERARLAVAAAEAKPAPQTPAPDVSALAIHHQASPCTIAGFWHLTEPGKDRPAVAYVINREDAALFAAARAMVAALRLAKPVCADAYYDALAVQENPTGDAKDYPTENAQSTAAALAAWEAVNAAIRAAEGREG